MTEVTHQKCPKCNGEQFAYNTETGLFNCFSGSCGFNSKGVGLCFDGNTIVPFKNKYEEEEGMSLEPFFKEFRGIHKTIMEKYGAYFTEHDGKETVHYTYPEGSTKHKDQSVPKKHKDHIKISGKMDKFYGQDDYTGGSILTITEGEEDRLSVIQMMGDYPCVSVPNAHPSKEFWSNARDYLEKFEKIYLSVDNDPAGDKLAEMFFKMLPGKVYRVDHGKYKDANDFLVAEDYAGYKKAWWNAQKIKPETINTTADDFLKVYDDTPNYEYFKTDIEELDEKMLGIHKSALTLILAESGLGKCLGPMTPVMLWDGSILPAKSIQKGMYLMGDDSSPRLVTSTTKGVDQMYKITPVKGDSWTCNSVHTLTLQHSVTKDVIDIDLDNFLADKTYNKHHWKQFRVPVEDFGSDDETLPLHPYVVGAFLGDGCKDKAMAFFGKKKDGVREKFVSLLDNSIYKTKTQWETKGNCWSVSIRNVVQAKGKNPFISIDVDLVDKYKVSSVDSRKEFLAGLLDTDGHFTSGCYDIIQKDKRIADAIAFTARSLGLAAYVKPCKKGIKSTGFTGNYWRVSISGDVDILPTVRHNPPARKQIKSPLRTGFSVEPIGEGEYYGFTLDGNQRFLLGDFTVTHNTELMRYLEKKCYDAGHSFAFCHGEETQLRSLLGLVSYELQDNLTRKDLIEAKGRVDEVKECLSDLGKSERVYQFRIRVDQGVDDIIDQIRFLSSAMNVDYIFLEPIQDFVSGNTTEKESLITDLANKMKRLAAEINVGIIIIAHANADGDAKYCKSLTQSAAYEIILERDPNSEDESERNKMNIFVGRKNRTGGGSGPAGCLTFDVETYMLTPSFDSTPVIDRSKKVVVKSKELTDKELEDEIPF